MACDARFFAWRGGGGGFHIDCAFIRGMSGVDIRPLTGRPGSTFGVFTKGSAITLILLWTSFSQDHLFARSSSFAFLTADRASPSLDELVIFISLMSSSCFGRGVSSDISAPGAALVGQVASELFLLTWRKVHIAREAFLAEQTASFGQEFLLDADGVRVVCAE